jgi:hypothetical protein|tara:strand:- start:720 stop:1055 length:336 start_codon:yes stop_codon:yes gene_type:complete
MSNPKERYVVVTTVSQFRQRYAVPVSELQALNPDIDISADPAKQIEWAKDNVTCEDVKEFSQKWIGEQIIDGMILDEERIVNLFDRDNDYLKEWTRNQKLDFIADWKDTSE